MPPAFGADEVALKQAGLIDEYGKPVDHPLTPVDEVASDSELPGLQPFTSEPIDENSIDETPLDEVELKRVRGPRHVAESDLSPLVSIAITPIATTELFKTEDAPLATERVETPAADRGYSALDNVPEVTENDDVDEVAVKHVPDLTLEEATQARIKALEAAERADQEVEEAQAGFLEAKEARDKLNAVQSDEEDSEVEDAPVGLGKESGDDEGFDLSYDELEATKGREVDAVPDEVDGDFSAASPTGPLSPVASADPEASYDDDSAYDSTEEDGVDEIADSLVKESADSESPTLDLADPRSARIPS